MSGAVVALLLVSRATPINTINTYNAGTGATETIPSGANQVVIEEWGGGGGGGKGAAGSFLDGGGGGSGAYVKKTYPLNSGLWGKTFTYTVGASGTGSVGVGQAGTGGASTVTNGTFPLALSMVANGGTGGFAGAVSGANGAGGTATGGDVNTNGNGDGVSVSSFGNACPNGGAAQFVATTAGNPPGGGASGGSQTGSLQGLAGGAGRVRFTYT